MGAHEIADWIARVSMGLLGDCLGCLWRVLVLQLLHFSLQVLVSLQLFLDYLKKQGVYLLSVILVLGLARLLHGVGLHDLQELVDLGCVKVLVTAW